jgi:hypothetical protein
MSGMSKALPGLGQDSPMRERSVPELGRPVEPPSIEPRAGTTPIPDFPPGKSRTSRASSRMKASDWIGGESTGMEVGSSRERGASKSPSLPRY